MSDTEKVIFVVVLIIGAVLVSIWLGKVIWHWVVPDVFSGMVQAGLLPDRITSGQSAKLMILLWAFGAASKSSSRSK